jgi:hypothetical protein
LGPGTKSEEDKSDGQRYEEAVTSLYDTNQDVEDEEDEKEEEKDNAEDE